MDEITKVLSEFQKEKKLTSKGKLAAILYVTRLAKQQGLPLDSSVLVTDSKGQVLGLGKTAVQGILNEYGIMRVLAEEGGRTSRGSLGNMQDYVALLNGLSENHSVDVDLIERWWIARVNDFFTAQPFILRYDTGKSLRAMVRDLMSQAYKRQKENPGTMYAGATLQHLVGAKLGLVLPEGILESHGYSVADSVSARSGDFIVDEVIIHVTTSPGEALMRKCHKNLDAGLKPIVITTYDSMPGAESLAKIEGIEGRVDILEAEQFIAANVYELSQFKTSERKITIEKLIEKYNEIVDMHETDPSLRITIG